MALKEGLNLNKASFKSVLKVKATVKPGPCPERINERLAFKAKFKACKFALNLLQIKNRGKFEAFNLNLKLELSLLNLAPALLFVPCFLLELRI